MPYQFQQETFMLTTIFYNLCNLLSTPYEKLNSISYNIDNLNSFILEEIYLKKLFYFKWRKNFNSLYDNFKFYYTYDILNENSNFIKTKLNLKVFFTIEHLPNNIPSGCVYEYIVILERFHNKFKIQFLIEQEENPYLYNSILKADLSKLTTLIFSTKQNSWINKLSCLELLYQFFMTSISSTIIINNDQRKNSIFNITEACSYAEAFALKPNPSYKYFENIGGDCTNFISQILIAGGLKQTHLWKPYTIPWIRVEDLYLYLTRQKLATKLPNKNSLSKGCIIQFYTPKAGRFFHTGFITYELPNNDYLYCCHSYNKLNYPLSEIYPHRYPVIRCLKIN